MKKNLLHLIVCSAAALAMVGCETSSSYDHGPYLPVNVTVNDVENRATMVLLSEGVQNSVTCPGIQETHLPDGRLQVIAHLRNRENRRIQVQANCEFKDSQGFVIDATPFENVFIDENAQEDVKFISMNDKPVRYTIRIREAR